MKKEYFIIDFEQTKSGYSFKLLEEKEDQGIINNVIAEDDFGNKIFIRNKSIYAYIHDNTPDKIKIFKNYKSFIENTIFYTEDEFSIIQNERIERNKKSYIEQYGHIKRDKLVNIRDASVYLGKLKINRDYMVASSYNLTKALEAGIITQEDFDHF